MPWCDDCAKFWNPSSMNADGTCPSCGRALASAYHGRRRSGATAGQPETSQGTDVVADVEADDPEARPKAPWHFKLLVVAVVLYTAFRIVQMISWLF